VVGYVRRDQARPAAPRQLNVPTGRLCDECKTGFAVLLLLEDPWRAGVVEVECREMDGLRACPFVLRALDTSAILDGVSVDGHSQITSLSQERSLTVGCHRGTGT
jgi:hypothetical protein